MAPEPNTPTDDAALDTKVSFRSLFKLLEEIGHPMLARIAAIEAKLAALETAPKNVKTVERFEAGRTYEVGAHVEFAGRLWRCDAATQAAPGVTDRWQVLQ